MTARVEVAGADAELDRRLSEELDRFNGAVLPGVGTSEELTVRCVTEGGRLLGGVSGWTWGEAAGIGMVWVDADQRGAGWGNRLMDAFEEEARRRGCRRIFVTSFVFQAPAFYERRGYRETGRWQGVPVAGVDDVHLSLDLRG